MIGPVGFVVTCKVCCRRCAVEKRRQTICDGCWPAHRRDVKRRSDQKNAERVREAGRRWRAANPARVRELERRREAKPERKAYHRDLMRELYWRKRAAGAAPLWAIAAAEVKRTWLALPAGPPADEKTGPCCPVACHPPRRFVAGWCADCGRSFVRRQRGPLPRCCSTLCAKRHDKRQYEQRKRAAFVEPVFRRKVFERDGWRCQLCRKLVKRTAVVPHPRAPTIDHIVPTGKGGEHSMANAQTAHFMCNSEKGAQARNEQLRLVG